MVIHGRHEYTDAEAEKLSRGARAVVCVVEDHVMYSKASEWRDGREIWSITRDPEQDGEDDKRHLKATGELPEVFEPIRKQRMAEEQQENDHEVDYLYSVPNDVASKIVGARYDSEDLKVEILIRRSLLQALFGG